MRLAMFWKHILLSFILYRFWMFRHMGIHWIACGMWSVSSHEFLSSFLVAFVKLWIAIISFVVSVCPSVRLEQLGFYWEDFREIWYLRISRKSVKKIPFLLQPDKNNGYFTKDLCTFIISRWLLLRMRNVSDESCRKNRNIFSLW
jgi:hypothetical protein